MMRTGNGKRIPLEFFAFLIFFLLSFSFVGWRSLCLVGGLMTQAEQRLFILDSQSRLFSLFVLSERCCHHIHFERLVHTLVYPTTFPL